MMYVHKVLEALLKNNGYRKKDVRWIGSNDGHFAMTVTTFLGRFGDQYEITGSDDIAYDLVIVLHDGSWFELEEGGGEQFWVFRKCPQPMSDAVAFDTYESSSIGRQSMADANSYS